MIIWLTGQPGSGKTTLAVKLSEYCTNPILIDGDDIRDVFQNKDYSYEGRCMNIRRAQDIALFLQAQGFTPIVSLVSPYLALREEFKARTQVFEIYCHCSEIRGREQYFVEYEKPESNYLDIDTTNKSIDDSVDEITEYIWKSN